MSDLLNLPLDEIWFLCRTEAPPECADARFWAALYERDFMERYGGHLEDSKEKYLNRVDVAALAGTLVTRAKTWLAFQQLAGGLGLSQQALMDIWQRGSHLNRLPADALFEIGMRADLAEIFNLCRASKRFNTAICSSQLFWKTKFIGEYGISIPANGNWREMYLTHGYVWGFGSNDVGQLALGNDEYIECIDQPEQISTIIAKQVSCGSSHTAIIDADDNAWICGYNETGQLGLNSNVDYLPTFVQIPLLKAKFVSCGVSHTAVIDLSNNVWTFGFNRYGQLGLGDTLNRKSPTLIQGIEAKSVSCGGGHTMIIDLKNDVLGFGSNDVGQLGIHDINNQKSPRRIITQIRQISCGSDYTAAITMDYKVLVTGENDWGQLGLGFAEDYILTFARVPAIEAVQVACGWRHTVLIDLKNNVWTCGDNSQGQLGLGDTIKRYKFTPVQTTKARHVSCGMDHTVIIGLEYDVWTCGDNDLGQLGIGEIFTRANVPQRLPFVQAKQISAGSLHTVMIT